MRLPSFFKKAIPKEYFLALLLQEELLRAVVFEESKGTIHIVGEGKELFPAPIDDISFEELLKAADKAISDAENTLPNNTQSHKTIFGVKEDWTQDLQINKEHLATLKKLCDELDLQPIGFLVFAEAIAHLLQKQEGAPVSALLIELGTLHITATLLRAGRVIASHQKAVEENLPKAVDSLLMQFSDAEILPSRIILLDNQKRPHITQQFTNHSWNKQLPFLHVPQVTPLPDDFETQAILFGTATQMGFDVLDLPAASNAVKKENEEAKSDFAEMEESEKVNESTTDIPEEGIEGKANEGQDEHLREPDEGGRLLDKGKTSGRTLESETSSESSGENFGFVKDADVLEAAPKKPTAFDNRKTPEDETPEAFANETFADIPEEVKEESLQSRLPGLGVSGVKITEGMQKVLGNIRKIPFSSFFSSMKGFGPSKKLLFLIPFFILLCIAGIIWYIFGVKATATLFIHPNIVKKSQGITFSSTGSTDTNAGTIGASVTSVNESGTSSTQATGSQDIGDKAKGSITIYNNDDVDHTISAGTTLVSANGLKFLTDTDVGVASASGDIFSGTKPGTQNVNVTAADIGTDYNLPSGTKLALGSSTVLAAKNDTAFSGGTKKTVTVVSQTDLDKLTSDLTKNLGDKAKQDAQNSAGSGKTILATFLSSAISNQKFDHKVGDQTSTINLAATITYTALAYNKGDLDKISLAILQSNNPGENISLQNISEDVQNPTASKDGKDVNATLSLKAGLLPKVDTTKVATALSGKSFSQAASLLPDIGQLSSVHAVLSPNLFFLPKIFPHIASHITVVIQADE